MFGSGIPDIIHRRILVGILLDCWTGYTCFSKYCMEKDKESIHQAPCLNPAVIQGLAFCSTHN